MTDDQGYSDLSCHGHPFLDTPNLDRFCARPRAALSSPGACAGCARRAKRITNPPI
jgi:hypothetical protein